MPQMGSLVQWIFELVDSYMINKVAATVSRVIEISMPVVVAAGTLMFMFYGVAIMRGAINEPVMDFIGRVSKIALVIAFATAGGLYQTTVMPIVLALPSDAVTAVVGGEGHSLTQKLDQGLNTSAMLASKVKEDSDWYAPFTALANLLLALAFLMAGALVSGLGLVTLLTVKVATALLTALGPAFILCYIFESTKGLTEKWIFQLVNYMLLSVLFAVLIEIVVSIQGDILAMTSADMGKGDFNVFQIIGVYGLFIFGVVFLIFQLPAMAASLAGGFGLQAGVGPLVAIARGISSGLRGAMPKLPKK